MMMHDCRHEINEIGSASDAESSRVDARQSAAVGDASSRGSSNSSRQKRMVEVRVEDEGGG